VHRVGNQCKTFYSTKRSANFYFQVSHDPRTKKSGHHAWCPGVPESRLQERTKLRLRFLLDVGFHFGGDVAEHLDGHRIFAQGFQRIGQLHLTLLNLEALRG
jgi:hypothetical protein